MKPIESVPVSFAGLNHKGKVPPWARSLNPRITTLADLGDDGPLSGVVVVGTRKLQDVEHFKSFLERLAKQLASAPAPVRLVVNLEDGGHSPEQLAQVFRHFAKATSRVEIADGREALESHLKTALAKYQVESEDSTSPDPLAHALEIIEARKQLLSDSGRLSAKAIAEALGFPLARLAAELGKTKQAVGKTPDSPALQKGLQDYERVLRLRAFFTAKQYRAWMELPNPQLDNHTPLQIIEAGRVTVVADLVEDMLTGNPA